MTMLALDELSPIGFGTYRLTAKPEHENALAAALDAGCTLIDTAATYAGGEAERLVGRVLGARPAGEVFVVTKAGLLDDDEEAPEAVRLRDGSGAYSIHPDFLSRRISESLRRLGLPVLDGFLLHNPEDLLDDPAVGIREYRRRVAAAFAFLDEQVGAGNIRFYGVSSNTLPLPGHVLGTANLSRLIRLAEGSPYFRLLQFPYNLAERPGPGMMDEARRSGLITLGNRPLNVKTPGGPLNLGFASASADPAAAEAPGSIVSEFTAMVDAGLAECGVAARARDLPLAGLLGDSPSSRSAEAIGFVFDNVVEPLVSRLRAAPSCGRLPDVARALRHAAESAARQAQARAAADVLAGAHCLNGDATPAAVCASYLRDGLDHVLVGMRRPEYVQSLAPIFAPAAADMV